MMEYKGYIAEYEYDDEAELYCGSVVNSGPFGIVVFEIPEGYDLLKEFQLSVDEYLGWCAEDGVEPVKPDIPNLQGRFGEYGSSRERGNRH